MNLTPKKDKCRKNEYIFSTTSTKFLNILLSFTYLHTFFERIDKQHQDQGEGQKMEFLDHDARDEKNRISSLFPTKFAIVSEVEAKFSLVI